MLTIHDKDDDIENTKILNQLCCTMLIGQHVATENIFSYIMACNTSNISVQCLDSSKEITQEIHIFRETGEQCQLWIFHLPKIRQDLSPTSRNYLILPLSRGV